MLLSAQAGVPSSFVPPSWPWVQVPKRAGENTRAASPLGCWMVAEASQEQTSHFSGYASLPLVLQEQGGFITTKSLADTVQSDQPFWCPFWRSSYIVSLLVSALVSVFRLPFGSLFALSVSFESLLG